MKKKSQEKRGGQRSLRVNSPRTEFDIYDDETKGNIGVVGTPELNIVEKED